MKLAWAGHCKTFFYFLLEVLGTSHDGLHDPVEVLLVLRHLFDNILAQLWQTPCGLDWLEVDNLVIVEEVVADPLTDGAPRGLTGLLSCRRPP